MLAGREPGEHGRRVVLPGCHDGERIDLRILGELPIIRTRAGDAVLARHLREALFRRIAKGGELKLRVAGDDPAMHRPEPADPDDSDPQLLHRPRSVLCFSRHARRSLTRTSHQGHGPRQARASAPTGTREAQVGWPHTNFKVGFAG